MGSTEKKKEAGLKVMNEMFGPDVTNEFTKKSGDFAGELIPMAVENVFGGVWARPGLTKRDRSLLTIAILIQARALDELRVHFRVAITNGLTKAELAEVLYHAAAYCGIPAAHSAREIALQVLGPEQ
ncbi:MAG: carboxymuconolactone decarboxylase family protein [Sphingobium sp.]